MYEKIWQAHLVAEAYQPDGPGGLWTGHKASPFGVTVE